MIRVSRLRKHFGRTPAVDDVSFDVRPGETFGLLGPNGAGKTTTLHLMLGLLRPDAGTVALDGGDPATHAVRRAVGAAPQALALYDDLTGAENLAFFGRLQGLGGRVLRDRVRRALERAGLVGRADDLVRDYSAGMKRRLHLQCALIHEPRVLFLDEPTVAVDPQARHHILADIETLKREGRTVVLTTHYMEEAQRLCDRVAIMDHGRILALDTVPRLIADHGGRAALRIELQRPPDDPAQLPGRLDETTLLLDTDEPFEVLRQLASAGVEIREFYAHQPDLEAVFLNLTGRRLRD